MAYSQTYDVAIIGGGIAGLSVALRLPESVRIALFTKGLLGESNTRYAQGGLAATLGSDDSPELHFQDTLAAGAGHCNAEAVRILVEQAPAAVQWLIAMGVQFDRAQPGDDVHATPDGLLLGREAAHSRWRVLHAGGDATGAEIERALVNALRKRSSVVLYEETFVSDLLVKDGVCGGVEAIDRHGYSFTVESQATILASGGAGGLWLHTSNPSGATADGLALAWHAGAALTDLEFMQFHPTVLVVDGHSHLISEAVRGEGAYLRNHAGERFMPRYHLQAELAPRDIVARAILGEMLSEQTDCQYLDLRHLPAERMYARFPTIASVCRGYGLDLAKDLLPVAPAAHYCMGGVMTDTEGRTTLPGLYAVGEVACTGVHGANRLASNSLLEGLVFGLRTADMLVKMDVGTNGKCGLAGQPQGSTPHHPADAKGLTHSTLSGGQVSPDCVAASLRAPCLGDRYPTVVALQELQRELRQIMWQYVSLSRNEEGLLVAKSKLEDLCHIMQAECHPWRPQGITTTCNVPTQRSEMHLAEDGVTLCWLEMCNMLQVAELVIIAALQRRESRGSHWRSDYNAPDESLATYHYVFQHRNTDLNGLVSNSCFEEALSHA